jgi:hypothetical protein
VGRNFAPCFEPQLTPKQTLELGVFGGKHMIDCRDEFPPGFFSLASLAQRRTCSPMTTGSFALTRLGRHREAFLNPRFPERRLAADRLGRLIAVDVEA